MKIQTKLLLFAILGSILPLFAAFLLIFNAAQTSLTKTAEENLLGDAKSQLSSLQNKLSYSKQELVTLSEMGNMQTVLDGDRSGALQADLDIFASRTPVFTEVLATNARGEVVASNLHEFIGTSLRGTWEYEAPRLGIHFDGRVVESYRLGMPIATHSVPLYDRTNPSEIIGVLIGSISWAYLQKSLELQSVFGGPQSMQRQVMLQAIESEAVLYATEGIVGEHDFHHSLTNKNEVKEVGHGHHSFMMASVVSEATGGFRDPKWRLHVLLDTHIAFAGVHELANYFFITAIVFLLLAALTGWLFARKIVIPVNSLAVGADLVAKGDYEHVLKETGAKDEIGQLTHSFNEMRIAVRDKQNELIKKTELAQQAAQAKGEFLANMSHEVRTPINGVLGMTELLLNTPLEETQGRYARTIYRSGQALLAVINDILDFSKLEAGKLELTISSFDLRELVEDVVEMLAENAAKKDVELILLMDPGSPVAFHGDSARLRQVLINLLSNAIKFTATGEVRLEVTMPESTAENLPVKFRVIDTGIGISPESQKQIFDSFVQADGSTTRQYGGTGLGLAISTSLIELMGANINVKSALGVGSEFGFEIDLEKIPAHVAAKWQESGALAGKRVLIVDDTQTNREILDAQLQFWSAETVVAASGAAALHELMEAKENDTPFDLAILDMHMPILSGTDLAAAIQINNLASHTELVLLSSACDNMTLESCKQLGISALVAKPARQIELYNVLIASSEQRKAGPINVKEVSHSIVADECRGHLLLVEDNPVNQDMMCEMLRILGHTVEVAENGQVALDCLEHKQFDLVLMDCQMPVLDGFDATKAIRKAESLRADGVRQAIVALTANALQGDKEKCLETGMDDYLSKPVSVARLKAVLKQWLSDSTDQSSNHDDVVVFLEPESEPDVSTHPILNEKVHGELLAMCANAPTGFYSSLIDKFEVGSLEDISKIRKGLDANDAQSVGNSAHRLKSSSVSIGSLALSELCQTLESAAKNNSIEIDYSLCDLIDVEHQKLLSLLRLQEQKVA